MEARGLGASHRGGPRLQVLRHHPCPGGVRKARYGMPLGCLLCGGLDMHMHTYPPCPFLHVVKGLRCSAYQLVCWHPTAEHCVKTMAPGVWLQGLCQANMDMQLPACCMVTYTEELPLGCGAGALLIKKLAEPVLGQRDEIYVSNVVVGFGSDAIKFSCHSTVNSVQVRVSIAFLQPPHAVWGVAYVSCM